MGALYHLKQRLVDFANVVQQNLNRSDTVPSSKVLYDETTEIKESLSTNVVRSDISQNLSVSEQGRARGNINAANAILESIDGYVASFEDGADEYPMQSVAADIEPVQDLHGYDHPWPAGGGKNLLNVTANTTTINGITYTVNKDTQGNVVSINANGTSTGTAYIGLEILSLKEGTYKFYIFSSGLASKWYADCPDSSHRVNSEGGTFTVSSDGDVAIWFNIHANQTINNVLFYPMVAKSDVTVNAYEPYSNICPISGWDEVNVTRTGKNLADMSGITIGKNWTGASASNRAFGSFACISGKTYNIKVYGIRSSFKCTVIDMNAPIGNQNTYFDIFSSDTVTLTAVGSYIGFQFQYSTDAVIEADALKNVFIVLTESPINTYTTDLTQTVYGGTLDVVSGVLTIDRAIVTYSDSTGFAQGNGDRWYHNGNPSGLSLPDKTTSISNTAFYNDTFASDDKYGAYFAFGSTGLYVNKLSASETIEEFSARLTANPMQIVYPIATPTTVQLTKQQVTTLLGLNNIWADSGEVSVFYTADTKLYIDKKFETLTNAIISMGGNV